MNIGENQDNTGEESDQGLQAQHGENQDNTGEETKQLISEPNTPLSLSSSNPPTCPGTNCHCKRLLESKNRTIRRLRKSVKGLKQNMKTLKRVSCIIGNNN